MNSCDPKFIKFINRLILEAETKLKSANDYYKFFNNGRNVIHFIYSKTFTEESKALITILEKFAFEFEFYKDFSPSEKDAINSLKKEIFDLDDKLNKEMNEMKGCRI